MGAGAGKEWERTSRFGRRARIDEVEWLTGTGTVRIALQVVDGGAFDYFPGHFVAVREEVPGYGPMRSPYCLFSPPAGDGRFEILVRVFPEGPLASHLASARPGTVVRFRGPSGRSMLPSDPDADLVMMATGVGISPLRSLCHALVTGGHRGRLRLYWGLRLTDDICLTDDLDDLVARHPDFAYQISLSRPPPAWPGLRGRLGESVPPLLDTLGRRRYYLTGNGAMVEEMEVALTTLGVDRTSIHEERFFNVRHRADPAVVEAIVSRCGAHDLFSLQADLLAHGRLFPLERDRD
ncbi:MAG: ferredoxin--NADP reductase [Acidimicrobiales bacterium]